ncbi:lasso RiPP family leader peptide-containing protein [Streptomyces marispadix]|uniref:Lasso RiPP family leader peptide-containing protein n=1 Tax=Streptomyces marispadix TaxID=2922868 RepID=A0ABS9T5K0_9ACTN|nr:lasso RiPP family leader peptide-containing protein [Streptomyces marispadix]MCH6163777.1 lasso RiPP family leader peptide-containing protein [Streptomyces marispadix]
MTEETVYEPPALTPAGDFSEDTLGSAVGFTLDGGQYPYHVYFGGPPHT